MTGTFVYTYYGEGTPTLVAQPLTGVLVEALVWSGTAWVTYPGSGDVNGNFTIPNVPSGEFLVDVGGIYAYTSARTIDLGYELSGRSTAVQENDANTIGVNAANLAAWTDADDVSWYDPNGPGYGYGPNPTPAVGATSIASADVCDWNGSLIDASKGDVLYFYQLHGQGVGTAGTASTFALTRFASFATVEQTDGTPLVLTSVLTTVPANQSVTVDFRASQFIALASDIHSGATGSVATYDVYTQPGASVAGAFGYTATLIELDATADQNLGLSFGNPFNASWGQISYAAMYVGVPYTAAGATSATSLNGGIFVSYPTSTAVGAIVPTVSPVTSPTINGLSLGNAQTGVGVTPTIAWSPPTTGTPTEYFVTLYQLKPNGTGSQFSFVAQIATTTTSIVLPPGVLVLDKTTPNTYVIDIQARISPISGSTQPYRSSPTLAGADMLTAIFTP